MTLTALATFLGVVVCAIVAKLRLLSFRAQRPGDYAATSPEFDIKRDLNGPIMSEGVIYGPTGRMTSSFVARMHGEWDGDSGTLTEDFVYSSGVTMQRKWNLTMGPGKTFVAKADDIEGSGQGVISGSTVMLRYRIRLPEESGGHVLDTTDWMYLMGDGTIMNRSEMRKFGIKVAELIASMRPDSATSHRSVDAS
ncbi:DUF3833 domain-containing protein [Tropicimonas sp. IMCC6043]|uniref:DUF3833 domain-containing protein n=1 Tax=Tropicimonas sp. IMCC6043 TaxID=2510645 RepID=UPI00101BC998|nr:DUF3833 domain-containing protein [Tropicimonas sp. IMCC6043]RYH08146.1 DUF3833 domain-containing protein [Tropicimonas sp. IMCC6043]